MRVFVTGGSGFVGSALVLHLVSSAGAHVLNLDKLTYAAHPLSLACLSDKPAYAFVHGDVGDRALVAALFSEYRPDAVVHLAAESHVDRSIDDSSTFISTNVLGTWTMLQGALEYWRSLDASAQSKFRFLHVSTDEVFGSRQLDEPPSTEGCGYAPTSPYSASKASADHLVRAWHHTYGLPVLITHASNNYGPRQFPEKLIPTMIIKALELDVLPVYGDGRQIRDWIHVEEHVRALELVLRNGRPGASYNIGCGSEQSNISVVEAICDLVDDMLARPPHQSTRHLIRSVSDRPGHDRRYALDCTLLRRELGFEPQISFVDGLRSTVRWYLDNEAWWKPLRGSYAGERLGLGPEGRSAQT
jgi:dTDP-glucose 4,6-dehydratase